MATQVGYTEVQLAVTAVFSELVSALSFLGSLFVVLVYTKYKPLRKWSFTLVFCLALTDLANQFFDFLSPSAAEISAMLVPGAPLTGKCWAQALGNGVFELASVLWTGSIALTLYQLVWLRQRLEAVERTLPRLCLIAFGVPTALTLMPLLEGAQVYGPAGGHASWCWIRPQYPHWVFLCFYVPLWCVMLFNGYVHVRTRLRLQGIQATGGLSAAAAEEGGGLDVNTAARFQLILQRLSWYPWILLIVWGPASINRVLEAATGGRSSFFALYFLQRVFSSSQGLLNAIAYGLTRGVREAVLRDLHPYLPAWCSAGSGAGSGAGSSAGASSSSSGSSAAAASAEAAAGAGARVAIAGGGSSLLSSEAMQSVDASAIGSATGSARGPGQAVPGAVEEDVEEDTEDRAGAAPPRREAL